MFPLFLPIGCCCAIVATSRNAPSQAKTEGPGLHWILRFCIWSKCLATSNPEHRCKLQFIAKQEWPHLLVPVDNTRTLVKAILLMTVCPACSEDGGKIENWGFGSCWIPTFRASQLPNGVWEIRHVLNHVVKMKTIKIEQFSSGARKTLDA